MSLASKHKTDQFLRRLKKVRHRQQQQKSSHHQLNQGGTQIQNSSQNKIKRLKQVYLKIKVQSLVKNFISRLKRNIRFPVSNEYDVIQNTLIKKQQNKQALNTILLSNSFKCSFIILNNICVLLLQTLSIFQGFFQDFRNNQSQKWPIITLKSICVSVFMVKILISAISQKVATQRIMHKLKYLATFYFFSWAFFFDFILCFLTFLILLNPSSQVLGIITFIGSILCFFAFSNNFQIVQVVYINNLKKKQYWDLLKILIFDIFFAQFIVSIFVAMSYYDTNKNWIVKAINNSIINPEQKWWQIYIYAYYWAITTISSVGYGDITQGNYFQSVIVVIVMLFGYLVLAYNVSQIWNIMSNLRKIDVQKKQDTAIFKRMVIDQKIPQQMEQKILNYIHNIASIKAEYEFLQRKRLLQKLPLKLRQQYQEQASKNIFSKIPFFKFLHFDTLIALAQNLQRKIYYPGEYLTQKIQKLASLMFLKHGQIGFAYYRNYSNINGLILQSRSIDKEKDNPYLLNKYLLTRGKQINYHIIAKSYCFLYVIAFQKFRDCLRLNSIDNQFYFKLYNKQSYIDQQWDKFQCQYCAPRRHSIFQCPKLHFAPFKSIVIYRYMYKKGNQQSRKVNFKRKRMKISRKKTLLLRKMYFKGFQTSWGISQNKILLNMQNDRIQVLPGSNSYEIKNNQDYEDDLRHMKGYHFQYYNFSLEDEYDFDIEQIMDKMHNFSSFFPEDNPSELIHTPLLKKKNKLKHINFLLAQSKVTEIN